MTTILENIIGYRFFLHRETLVSQEMLDLKEEQEKRFVTLRNTVV